MGVRSLWATPIVMEEATLPRYTYTQTHSCLMKPDKRIWQYMLHWFDVFFVVRIDGYRYFGGFWVGLLWLTVMLKCSCISLSLCIYIYIYQYMFLEDVVQLFAGSTFIYYDTSVLWCILPRLRCAYFVCGAVRIE